MATENAILMKNARQSLDGKWALAVGTFFVAMIIIWIAEAVLMWIPFAGIAVLVVSAPLGIGLALFSLNISRSRNAELEQMFDGFKNFGTAFITYLLMAVFIFLWSLLLIVPGIIAAFSYAMAPFIIVENPDIQPMEAIDKSKAMMNGYKAKLFRLYLRFFGWALLCILTFGIGFFWLVPYMNITLAKFYDDIKYDLGEAPVNHGASSPGGPEIDSDVDFDTPPPSAPSEKTHSNKLIEKDYKK